MRQDEETAPSGGLAQRAATGVAWSISQKWVIRITGLVTIAILTRLLTPADFGVVAVALTLLPLLQVLSDLGFSAYLVQAEKLDARTLSTAFWFSTLAGLVLSTVLVLSAPAVGALLGLPEVVPVVQAFAPAALAVTLGSVPVALLRREMRFRAIAMQAVIAGAAGQVAAVVLALLGFGVWALVAQTVLVQTITTVLAWWATRWHPVWAFSRTELARMMRFGFKVVGVEFVSMGRLWAENAVVLAVLGPAGLGYLNIAQRLVQTAQDLTTSALVPVSVVVFAQIRSSTERLRAGYLRAQGVSYALVVPIMLGLAVGAPWVVPLMFGPQWQESVVPAAILAVSGMFMLGALDHGLFYGLGRPGTWFVYAALIEALALTVTVVAAPHGLVAVASGSLAVAVVATLARWPLVGRRIATPWWRVAAPMARVALPAVATAAAGVGVAMLAVPLPAPLALAAVLVVMMAVYLPLLRLCSRTVWGELRGFAVSAGRRVFRRGTPR